MIVTFVAIKLVAEENPNCAFVYHQMGIIHGKQGDFLSASVTFEHALALSDNALIHLDFAKLLYFKARQEVPKILNQDIFPLFSHSFLFLFFNCIALSSFHL